MKKKAIPLFSPVFISYVKKLREKIVLFFTHKEMQITLVLYDGTVLSFSGKIEIENLGNQLSLMTRSAGGWKRTIWQWQDIKTLSDTYGPTDPPLKQSDFKNAYGSIKGVR